MHPTGGLSHSACGFGDQRGSNPAGKRQVTAPSPLEYPMDEDICFKMSTYRYLGAVLVEHRNPYKVLIDYFLYQRHCFSRSTFRFDIYFMENPRISRFKYLKIDQTTHEGGLMRLFKSIRDVYLLVISMTWLTKYFDCLVSTLTKT